MSWRECLRVMDRVSPRSLDYVMMTRTNGAHRGRNEDWVVSILLRMSCTLGK